MLFVIKLAYFMKCPKNILKIWIYSESLKLKSSKKSRNQAQFLQIWCYILEKKILSIKSGILNNVLPWMFCKFCSRKKFYSYTIKVCENGYSQNIVTTSLFMTLVRLGTDQIHSRYYIKKSYVRPARKLGCFEVWQLFLVLLF